MARLPGNEQLHFELTERELHVPTLPPQLDGVSILHLSDLHFDGTIDRPFFDCVMTIAQTMPADLVLVTGDILDRKDRIDWLAHTLGRLSAPLEEARTRTG